jgi:hypothetical protein
MFANTSASVAAGNACVAAGHAIVAAAGRADEVIALRRDNAKQKLMIKRLLNQLRAIREMAAVA